MIEIYTGKTGTGKSLKLAEKALNLLYRNLKWYKKTGQKRKIVSNIRFSHLVEHKWKNFIEYWENPEDLIKLVDVDIIWDEIATHLDSTQWQNMSLELKRFLQQHRKKGIDIYGTTQAFGMIDISMRRLVDNLYVCYKLFGSRNPSPTKPPIKRLWGVIWISEFDPMTFEDEKPKSSFYQLMLIKRELVEMYDTRQEITAGKYPPLRHIVRECQDPDCGYRKVLHY